MDLLQVPAHKMKQHQFALFIGLGDEFYDAVKSLVTENQYKQVATFNTTDLNKAFELANTNSSVTHRSASCGDVFKLNNQYFLIEAIGFKDITEWFLLI